MVKMTETLTFDVTDKSFSEHARVLSLQMSGDTTLASMNGQFVQTEDATKKGVAVHKYGAVMLPVSNTVSPTIDLDYLVNGVTYRYTGFSSEATGSLTFTKVV